KRRRRVIPKMKESHRMGVTTTIRWFMFAVIWTFVVSIVASAQSAASASGTDLYSAIRANNLTELQSLVAKGANVNAKGPGDVTPLMDAALAGSLDAMKFLIAKGADVNAKDSTGRTALIRCSTDLAKIRLLLDHGADINAVSDAGRTVLLTAA